MNSIGHAASTPLSRFNASQSPNLTSTKQARDSYNLRLSLSNVVGITTNSVNAFDALPEHNTFVCCAGTAAVLSRVNENLQITQRVFRLRPNVSATNATPSFYNVATPPSALGKSRHGSPFKNAGFGVTHNGLVDYPPTSPSQGRANIWSRETSCVSLSRGR